MAIFRSYSSDDLDALYAISLATGDAGSDASYLYRDGRLMGHIYAAPYALLAPELVLVAENDGQVAGFVVGELDTQEWLKRLERCWWPKLRQEYSAPAVSMKDCWTPDERRTAMIHDPESPPAAVLAHYPAHLHLNLVPTLQGQGVGTKLLQAWFDVAFRHGAVATHVGVNRANSRGLRFWTAMGFRDVTPRELRLSRVMWMGHS